jgi:hypothetical protein
MVIHKEDSMKKALLILCVAVALAFSGCSMFYGEDGDVYLKVTSSYGFAAGFETGLGLGSGWYSNTNYKVNPGTWDYIYSAAEYYGYLPNASGYYRYWYSSNATTTKYGYTSAVGSSYAAGDFYDDGYYLSKSVTITANEGTLFMDGDDAYYTLDLGWYSGSSTVSDKEGPLASKVILDNAEKTVTEFVGSKHTITITENKKAVAGPLPANFDMNAGGRSPAGPDSIQDKI